MSIYCSNSSEVRRLDLVPDSTEVDAIVIGLSVKIGAKNIQKILAFETGSHPSTTNPLSHSTYQEIPTESLKILTSSTTPAVPARITALTQQMSFVLLELLFGHLYR